MMGDGFEWKRFEKMIKESGEGGLSIPILICKSN